MQMVLDTYGLSLSVRNGCFLVTVAKEKRMVHPSRIDSILVTMPCRLSTPAILLAATNEIALTICTLSGKPEARLWSPRFLNISTLRRAQYGFTADSRGVSWSKGIITAKLDGQMANLKYIAGRKPALSAGIAQAITEIGKAAGSIALLDSGVESCMSKLRYYEAYSAKCYWPLVGEKLHAPFAFTVRTKRNPPDAFNSCINYLYGMLRNQVETAILSLGLDPALGCMHRDGYKLPSLVFDLMEPFRPIIDRLLIEAVLEGKIKAAMTETDDFDVCHITREGRKALIAMFNEKLHKVMVYQKAHISLLNQILLQTRHLADEITGKR